MTYEIVFSKKCFPQSRIIRADRYEIRPDDGTTNLGEQILFYRGDYIVERESVWDVKEIKAVEQARP